MSRGQRIRVAFAVLLGVVGTAVYQLGPGINTMIWTSYYTTMRESTREMVLVSWALAAGGFAVAALSFLYVFTTWARWFVGPAEG